MREIVLDTETTGLDPFDGHRVVEIGALELINHLPTGRTYHQYINPERPMPAEAFAVHGLGDEFLSNQPRFVEIADQFLAFAGDAKLVIHNAAFDMKFLNAELGWCQRPKLPNDRAIDTLMMARKKFPGASASLDSLCRRFNIDNSARVLHGALLDSEILAEVYLELIGGRQPGFSLSATDQSTAREATAITPTTRPKARSRALPSRLTEAEKEAHRAFIAALGPTPLWMKETAS